MSNDDHKGIVNILNLPHRYREETPRVPFKSPELTTSEILMKMKPIELPKSVPEKKDDIEFSLDIDYENKISLHDVSLSDSYAFAQAVMNEIDSHYKIVIKE